MCTHGHVGATCQLSVPNSHMHAPALACLQMLGVHSRRRNASVPLERARGTAHAVANPDGDLDAYVVHFDEPKRFGGAPLKPLWNALSRRMHAMMPSASAQMVKELHNAHVRERLYSTDAHDVMSDDMLVNNVGVSAAYKSPPHFDIADVYVARS